MLGEVYFVCYRHRHNIDKAFALEFLKNDKPKIHDNYIDAAKEMDDDFYDDCDYQVFNYHVNHPDEIYRTQVTFTKIN